VSSRIKSFLPLAIGKVAQAIQRVAQEIHKKMGWPTGYFYNFCAGNCTSGHFETEWFASRSPRPVIGVTDAGVVSEPLKMEGTANVAQLSGMFGVFYLGTAEISIKGHGGEVLQTLPLGRVSPEQALRLDQRVQLPTGTWRVSINVLDALGRNRGELGNVLAEFHGST
jgi:hypothetical protein